jgi:hypothetical protein
VAVVAAAILTGAAPACGGGDGAGTGPAAGGSAPVVAGAPGTTGTPMARSPGVSGAPGGTPGAPSVPSMPANSATGQGGTGPCGADELGIALGTPDSAKFEEDVLLVFTNTGSRTCSLSGFVRLQLRGPSGAMPTTALPQPGATAVIVLRPGQQASARLLWNKYEGQGSVCRPVPTSIAVTPPGTQAAETIPWVPGDDGSVCGGGTIRLYPVVAGAQGA